MKTNSLEMLTGFLVLLFAGIFLAFGLNKTDAFGSNSGRYELLIPFDNISGISAGSDVKMSGVKIGTVSHANIDKQSYRAMVHVLIEQGLKIPDDTVAKIASDGLLGGAHIVLDVGNSEKNLEPNEQITYSQSAVSLMDLLSRAIFSATNSNKEEEQQAN